MAELAMIICSVLLIFQSSTVVSARSITTADPAVINLISLYTAMYQLAFPLENREFGSDATVTERFIWQVPGLVLNPYDYDPGELYIAAQANPNDGQPEVNIPPYIMENMFQLVDPLPNTNPLKGGVSGGSLADTYRDIIYNMDVKKFDDVAESVLQKYQTAMEILQGSRRDPESATPHNVTLLDLYTRYKGRYYQKKQEVEEIIEQKKKSLPSIEYEKWFTRNYRNLQAQEESEYTRWILYGEKEVVDTYKIHLDVAPEGAELETAREVLRSSGISALDRSGTIYPVSYTPSNWYQYIIPG